MRQEKALPSYPTTILFDVSFMGLTSFPDTSEPVRNHFSLISGSPLAFHLKSLLKLIWSEEPSGQMIVTDSFV